jgi:polysaccharide deacetylase 2 family uncharacterized protein YibQ
MARRRTPVPNRRPRNPGRASSRRGGGFWLFLLGVLLGAGILFLFVLGGGFSGPGGSAGAERDGDSRASAEHSGSEGKARKEKGDSARSSALPVAEASALPVEEAGAPTVAPAAHKSNATVEPGSEPVARIALVIDDLGRSLEDVHTLEQLGVPISYSVLPFEEHTAAVVADLRRRGKEMLCHLPMEPRNGENPGPGALLLGMPRSQLRELTADALAAVPGATGVNNHMGSSLTEDEGSMEAILGVLKGRKLFFLDSRTSAQSVGYRTAMDLGVPAAERQVFLDNDPSPAAIEAQIQRLQSLARQRGSAIAIGHPYPTTLATLAKEIPRLRAAGFELVPVSYLLDHPGDESE